MITLHYPIKITDVVDFLLYCDNPNHSLSLSLSLYSFPLDRNNILLDNFRICIFWFVIVHICVRTNVITMKIVSVRIYLDSQGQNYIYIFLFENQAGKYQFFIVQTLFVSINRTIASTLNMNIWINGKRKLSPKLMFQLLYWLRPYLC